jgi:hypothetical protein
MIKSINISYKMSPLPQAGAKGEGKYSSYSFLISTLDGVSGQRHDLAALYPRRKEPSTHWTGGWVDLTAGLDTEATIHGQNKKRITLARWKW